MTDTTTEQRRPEEIERDIRDTQAEMSRTVEQIGGEFTGRNLFNSLLEKAEGQGVDMRWAMEAARRNPVALGLIAAGGLWLLSDADARLPSFGRGKDKDKSGTDGFGMNDNWHPEHRSYAEHMARCERQPGEDNQSYRRRRDDARASYFMLEQSHDEDESAFRQRLDAATETLRRGRENTGERAQAFARQSRERTRQAFGEAQGFYFDNPLMSGLAAAFVGAVVGAAIPATRSEEDYVGGLGEKALDAASAGAQQAGQEAYRRKDEAVGRIDESIAGTAHHGSTAGSHQEGEGGSDRPPRFAEDS
jgi:ElaB/YqjD/DUF883 family membrane-anchored ribosome-binding protein